MGKKSGKRRREAESFGQGTAHGGNMHPQKKKKKLKAMKKSLIAASVSYEDDNLSPEEAARRLKLESMPLYDTDYSEQLRIKTEAVNEILKNAFNMAGCYDESELEGLITLLPIIPSPTQIEYSNMNNLTIGYDLDKKGVNIGYPYKKGAAAVGDCSSVGLVNRAALPLIESFRLFVSLSNFKIFQNHTNYGNWKSLTVKILVSGDIMATAHFEVRVVHPNRLSDLKRSIVDFYTNGKGCHIPLKSFHMCWWRRDGTCKYELLIGEPFLHENFMQLKCRVSPQVDDSLFQGNPRAAEQLYKLVAEWSGASIDSTVLELYCDSGTLGLSMAKIVKRVIGVDMRETAVEEAKVNATTNGITNATFYSSKSDSNFLEVSKKALAEEVEVIAIVKPPERGLTKHGVRRLRNYDKINRVVYISSHFPSMETDMANFVQPRKRHQVGPRFKMVKALSVDLYPGFVHSEVVMLYDRIKDDPGITSQHEDYEKDDGDDNNEGTEKKDEDDFEEENSVEDEVDEDLAAAFLN